VTGSYFLYELCSAEVLNYFLEEKCKKCLSSTADSNRHLTISTEVVDKYNVRDCSTDFEQEETEVLAVIHRTGVALLTGNCRVPF
jgi:hypothetical protein